MIEFIVIIGFLYAVMLFLVIPVLWDLHLEQKRLSKKILDYKFKECYHRGKLKALREMRINE